MTTSRQLAAIRSLGQVEAVGAHIDELIRSLSRVRLWQPTHSLTRQCQQALEIIQGLKERMDRKLIVTLVGPSGAGKSTLLNALAGVDGLSETGHQRPTTSEVVAFSGDTADLQQLRRQIGDSRLVVKSHPGAASLDNVVLVDTPDTDSTHQTEHIPLIEAVVNHSDVLICVFDTENPKRRDHTDFLAPFVRRFNGESLVVALNKCDRQSETELRTTIAPEFGSYLSAAWGRPAERILCVSGRSHLQNPAWDDGASPRHAFDQFEQLKRLIYETFNQAEYGVDRRLQNARSLQEFLFQEVVREATDDRDVLLAAADQMRQAEQAALNRALEALKGQGDRQMLGIHVRLYQKLAQYWIGPVGWLIAMWARILLFGSGILSLFRFSNPLRQLWGLVSSVGHYRETSEAVAVSRHGQTADWALREFQACLLGQWPTIAEKLIQGRFSTDIRDLQKVLPDGDGLETTLSDTWSEALERVIELAAARLSGALLQLIFNLPVVALMGYVGWLTAKSFFEGQILTADFFIHALITIAIVLFLAFFLLQAVVRLAASGPRLNRRAFSDLQTLAGQFQPLSEGSLGRQVAWVAGMGQTVPPSS